MTDSAIASSPSLTEGQRLPQQRWQVATANAPLAATLAQATGLSPLLTQVLINRGITTPALATDFLDPERQQLPSPLAEFPDLAASLELLVTAINTQQAIAICGDYDADGMTSTALLLRALRAMGAQVSYTIPSRMAEGYGINNRIVEDCYADGVSIILTVDNGIAAVAPIARARELGLAVIITDHHDIPPEIPPANAILNPKLLSETSPYRGVAGVGVAYILAVCLAQALGRTQDLTGPLLELFTLGTIADLAPLTGVNRRWVRRGLGLLPRSRLFGIQALIQVAGLADQSKPLKPEHIGFRLGPRINAVGRIAEPQIVIDLLTTDDVGVALERAMQCEQINATRQDLCQSIEQEAIAWCEQQRALGTVEIERDRVLVVVQPGWHHGVIGIVASRLVERYGVPVFIGTYEDDEHKVIRGSARGIPEFDVFAALQTCHDLLEKFGGHRAAGGFSFLANRLRQVTARLSHYACQTLTVDLLKPLVKIDSQARLGEVDQGLFDQIDHLHPCGIENPDPVFWTPNLRVLEQQTVGRNRDHLKLVLGEDGSDVTIKAIAWRWGEYYPLPNQLDVAYKLKQNEWQGTTTVELELVGVRPAAAATKARPNSTAAVQRPSRPVGPSLPNLTTPVTTTSGVGPRPRVSEVAPESDTGSGTGSSLGSATGPGATEPTALDHLSQSTTETSVQPAVAAEPPPTPTVTPAQSPAAPSSSSKVEFTYSNRRYSATTSSNSGTTTLTMSNPEGQRLVVNRGDQQGWLYLPGESAKPVDVSEPHYGNLVRAGAAAVELKQLAERLAAAETRLAEQDVLLAQQSTLINALQAENATLLATQHASKAQFSVLDPADPPPPPPPAPAAQAEPAPSAVSEPETPKLKAPHPPVNSPEATSPQAALPQLGLEQAKQQVRHAVSDRVWFCLSADSQTDLAAALAHLAIASNPIPAQDVATVAGLATVLERELLQPLLDDFARYGADSGDREMVALANELAQAGGLSALPPLLSETWRSLTAKALTATTKPRKGLHHNTHADTSESPFPIDDTHRVMLDEFLQGWDHPIGRWLTGDGAEAASDLAQVAQLQSTHGAMPFWQGQMLQQLVLGHRQKKGILQKIFG
ncbi:single-stranded-DNA-specific exonuclease RecJ [Nodosilinea sp. E11]|uniref:single-stranded-DNA-specific exonuclease RecJ n=1 Tax=Nodosilinea sp. E11 TaxID=3037479 RepID=UPI0029343A3B|nr:single-stranded-DNA-specific exonuclease RecJ [Nodosilinea sp. E11]WOD41374.1 single-stranded-DNA-specific exonuclease RecJ [Nodosilinea sp. E11]